MKTTNKLQTGFKSLPKAIQPEVKANALKYLRFKDQLATIGKKEIMQFQLELNAAFHRLNARILHKEFFNGRFNSTFPDRLLIVFVPGQPYNNLAELTSDIKINNQMLVSTDNNNSALLPGDLNPKFRAVHDYLHYLLQQPFGYVGEYAVYEAQKGLHKSEIGKQILYSEICLQAAYFEYFGSFADFQKVVL